MPPSWWMTHIVHYRVTWPGKHPPGWGWCSDDLDLLSRPGSSDVLIDRSNAIAIQQLPERRCRSDGSFAWNLSQMSPFYEEKLVTRVCLSFAGSRGEGTHNMCAKMTLIDGQTRGMAQTREVEMVRSIETIFNISSTKVLWVLWLGAAHPTKRIFTFNADY